MHSWNQRAGALWTLADEAWNESEPRGDASLSDGALNELREMILTHRLPGGTFLIEGKLAAQLNISRTPLREALTRLAAEELLVKHGRSFSVRVVSAREFLDGMKMRELLEGTAVELSAGKIDLREIDALRARIANLASADTHEVAHWEVDDAIHLMFANASGNIVLARLIRELRVVTRLFELSRPFRRVAADGREHLVILDRFSAGDIKGARRAMARHMANIAEEVVEVLGATRDADYSRVFRKTPLTQG